MEQINTEALKKKILDLAIRGKLVEQDPNDEPASVLLERIREEKEELIKQKKIKRNKNESYIFKGDDGLYYEKFADGTIKSVQDEIPFEIPEGWEWVRLNEVAIISSGGTPKTSIESYWKDGQIPFVTPADMGKATEILINKPEKSITFRGLKESSATLIEANSIVFSSRAPIGHINIVPYEYATNQGCKSVTPLKISPYLIYFFIKTMTPIIERNATGTTFKEVSLGSFSRTLIPLVNELEQRRILNQINQLFKEIEIIEKNYQSLINIERKIKSKALSLAMQGKLLPQDPTDEPASTLLEHIKEEKEKLITEGKIKRNKNESTIVRRGESYYEQLHDGTLVPLNFDKNIDIPKGWCITKLHSLVINYYGGGTPSKSVREYWDGDIPWASVKDIKGEYLNETINFITQKGLENSSASMAEKGDLIVVSRINVGKVIKTNIKTSINQDLKVIKFSSDILKEYFYFLYQTLSFNTKGTTVKGITNEEFLNKIILVPPVNEQKRITKILKEINSF